MPIGRLRRGGRVLVLLAAVVFVVAVAIDCDVVADGAEVHVPTVSVNSPVVSVVAGSLSHSSSDSCECPCVPHAAHCLMTSLLPSGRSAVPVLHLFGLVVAAVLLGTMAGVQSGGGVRGPPVGALPVVGGRGILARICIARR